MGLLTQQKYLKMVVNFVWSFYDQAKTDEQNVLFSLRPSFTKFETLHVVDYADLGILGLGNLQVLYFS